MLDLVTLHADELHRATVFRLFADSLLIYHLFLLPGDVIDG